MQSRLKQAGLSIGAIVLLASVFAPSTSAQFQSEATSTILTVSSNSMQIFEIKAGGATVECTTVSLESSFLLGTSSTTATLHPTYSSCEEFLNQSVEIDENGCDFVLHLASSSTEGSVDVECPTSTGIQITAGNLCTYEIDSQTSLGTIKYANTGTSSTSEIEVQPSVKSITSTRTTNHFPFLCPEASSTGTYTGTSKLTGEEVGLLSDHVGVFVD